MTRKINQTKIISTFAEAFGMRYTRLIVTALNAHWLQAGLNEFCGYGSSVIGCDAEVGVESWLTEEATPDQRPGASVLAFGFSAESLGKAISNRVAQCLMTCPTSAVFSGLDVQPSMDPDKPAEKIELGSHLRFFGDGFQKSKLIGDRRYWRIPVMDGEFLVEETVGVGKGVGGGNLLIQSVDQVHGLAAALKGVEAISKIPGTITPFPGGVVRSGSKVGSRYKALKASTSHGYCPTLIGRVESELVENAHCCYEIVIDGVDPAVVGKAMKAAMEAAAIEGVLAISAGNYGGKLGKFHFHLHEILEKSD